MKHTTNSGKRNRSSKTLVHQPDQSSSDQKLIEEDQQPQAQSITFNEALEALDILIAQQGNQRIRDMHKGKIRDYMVQQEARIQILDKYSKLWGWKDVDNHVEAMAKLWNEESIICPPHQR